MRHVYLRRSGFGAIWGSVGPTTSQRYWGTQRVARVCQVSPATVASWIDQGLLKGHRTPTGRRRVVVADLVQFLKTHRMAVPPEIQGGDESDVVVVVEDDPGYLQALVLTIDKAELGVEVVEATTGVDGLLEIGRVQPAVIVLDYSLPDLNAAQVIRRLLEPGRRINAEVIVVSGGMPEKGADELRKMGVKVIVNKADGMPAVVEAMRQALRRRKVA